MSWLRKQARTLPYRPSLSTEPKTTCWYIQLHSMRRRDFHVALLKIDLTLVVRAYIASTVMEANASPIATIPGSLSTSNHPLKTRTINAGAIWIGSSWNFHGSSIHVATNIGPRYLILGQGRNKKYKPRQTPKPANTANIQAIQYSITTPPNELYDFQDHRDGHFLRKLPFPKR